MKAGRREGGEKSKMKKHKKRWFGPGQRSLRQKKNQHNRGGEKKKGKGGSGEKTNEGENRGGGGKDNGKGSRTGGLAKKKKE